MRATAKQVGLLKTERADNVQGAFRVAAEHKADIVGRRVVFIDDVLTSGATVEACARAQLRAGATHIDVLCSPGLWRLRAPPYKEAPASAERLMPPVEIYTTRYCPYCHAAKSLLGRKGVRYSEIDVGRNWNRREEMIQRANGRMTVPRIFVCSVHVGGSDELHALERAGKLDPLLAGDGASA